MKILFLSRWYPYPTNNGSKLRIYNLLRGLAEQHDVTVLSFADQPDVKLDIPEIRAVCRNIQVVPWKPFAPQGWQARLGFFNLKPRSVVDTFSPEMEARIRQALATENYDLIIASQIDMALYGHAIAHVPTLLEEIEVGVPYEKFTQASSTWSQLRYGLTWAKHRHHLAHMLRHYRACTVVSQREKYLLSKSVPGCRDIEVVPNCINLADYRDIQATPQPGHLIFTGSFRYAPNHDAMVWFLQHVYPQLTTQVSDVRLTITGDHNNLPLPPAENVTLTGFVDDVRPLLASAWISIVPIRVGGGTRLKILEAMALGTPVVTTKKGAEGLDVQSGEHLLIADSPQEFTAAIKQLLNDAELRQQLAANAYRLVAKKYDWAAVMPSFLNLVERVAYS